QFSMNAGFEWNGFDVSIVFQGAAKRTVWRMDGNGNADIWRVPMRAVYMNSTNHWVGNVWSEDNPNGKYPTLTNQGEINNYNYQCSSWSVEDGSYIRLKNVTLGYTLPANLLAKTHVLSNVRFYVTGTDLWEWSKINDGWDPEASNRVSNARRYPFLRNVTFGANISF
ncbi:MAG: SusC/RagA family TonB-linked outer membrane protein, partial [Muribaculaceae bacterium]|nr:SusC/RagA family TonB-linked outer membrane protein [Muribaculaceae bacterium]